jgi:flagellum-specific peptidoglycan hydrolase FlgJ
MQQIIVSLLISISFFIKIANASAAAPLAGAEDEEDELVRREYIIKYAALSIDEMKKTGIPASIILAQGILESEWGRASLAKMNKNHFGIKCTSGWRGGCASYSTNEYADGIITAQFRKYRHAEESFLDHSEILMNESRYGRLFNFQQLDYKNWAHGLRHCGYASDPRYAQKLIKIIEFNELFELDGHYAKPMPVNLADVIPLLRKTQKGPLVGNEFAIEVQAALSNNGKKKKKKK